MPEQKRKTILWISDHPLVPSGVGSQSHYVIRGLLETGKYRFVCFGGAIKHPNYEVQNVAPDVYGDRNWIVIPVDGHGTKELLRQTLAAEKPDAVILFTDPRFFYWVWEMEDEVRAVCPLLYWHVWDNDPAPRFNKVLYESTDHVAALSLKTFGLLQDLDFKRKSYIPHAVPEDLFKPLPDDEVKAFKKAHYGHHADKRFIVMWNNRNARRKQTGDVVESFAMFAKKVGKENVALFMHTQIRDPEGQDILAVAERFGVEKNLIMSEQRVEPALINSFYNAADCTINIASNEGFGLTTLESLFAGTPIIAHFTGGLQFQIGDWWEGLTDFSDQAKLTALAKKRWDAKTGGWWGVPVFSAVRSCVGSQPIPYIYDDRASNVDVAKAFQRLYDMGHEKRQELGARAREWAIRNFNLATMISSWDTLINSSIDQHKTSSRHRTSIL